MTLLVSGVLLWSAAHMLRGGAPGLRLSLIAGVGSDDRYKGLFSLTIVGAITLMVLGWRSTTPVPVYPPPQWGHPVALLLMLLALVLFAASGVATNIKRWLRHPQLAGVAVWATAHLLANGDARSVILFGGIGLWAVLEMLVINRRDGEWRRPEAVPISAEIKPIVGGLIGYLVLLMAHPYLFGVSPLP